MRTSEGVEWASHCAVVLAALPEGAVLPASRLAEYHDLPAPYLAKCLQALSAAGIVESVPGRAGGYRLARPAGTITLLDVVEAVEGTEPLFRCTEIRRRGPVGGRAPRPSSPCSIHAAMDRAEDAWRGELRATTVADLAASVAAKVSPSTLARAETWVGEAIRRPSR